MKEREEILKEIQSAIRMNIDIKKQNNTALSDAIMLIQHETKEFQKRLDEEYKRGLSDAWEIAREITTDYDEFTEIFGQEATIGQVIQNSSPLELKEKILSYREKRRKISIGDKVKSNKDDTLAVILGIGKCGYSVYENYWYVYTENGRLESWGESCFTKTGEQVSISKVFD